MLGLFTIFATSLLIGFSGAMMPGPLLTIAVGESARQGFRAGPLLVLGHGIGELALLGALAAGLVAILQQAPATAAIGLLGGGFLLWMGFGIVRGAWQGKVWLNMAAKTEGKTEKSLVVSGILVSLANPYWSLWWATIGLAYVVTSFKSGVAGLAAFYSGHILADLLWYSAIALVIATGHRFLGDRSYRAILVACGLVLIGLSFYFIGSGVLTLVGLIWKT